MSKLVTMSVTPRRNLQPESTAQWRMYLGKYGIWVDLEPEEYGSGSLEERDNNVTVSVPRAIVPG